MTKQAYLVVDGEYDDYRVRAVFTELPPAEAHRDKYGPGWDDARIETVPLDDDTPRLRWYDVYWDTTGVDPEVKETFAQVEEYDQGWATVQALDPAEAIERATQMRAGCRSADQYLQEQEA